MKRKSIIILLFFLSTTASAGTFLETFDAPNLEGWQELVQLNKIEGFWEIVDGELHTVSRQTFLRLLTTEEATWKDYTLALDVKPLKKHGIGRVTIAVRVNGSWGVYCNIHDPVVIIGDNPPIHEPRIDCVAGDLHDIVFSPLGSTLHPLLKLNRWSHLKLSVEGDTFTFWVNEKQVIGPTALQIFKEVGPFVGFPDFQMGGIGLGLSNYTARFDNITVTGKSIPNSGGFAVTQRGKLTTTWAALKMTAN